MTQRLTTETLSAIRQRMESATEGNWRATLDDPYERTHVLGSFNGGPPTVIGDIKGDADAIFIANARQDIPMLLAEVDRLREILDEIYEEAEKIISDSNPAQDFIRKVYDEVVFLTEWDNTHGEIARFILKEALK